MLYIRKFDNHEEYEDYLSGDTMVRPNVSRCVEEKDVHYKPVSYVYMRSNTKKSDATAKIKFENNMKLNVMDYITIPSVSSNTMPYCGYALIENTNIGDNAVANPTITSLLTENPYSFTPQEGKTYVVIQQASSSSNILFPWYYGSGNGSPIIFVNYLLRFFVPKYIRDVGAIINGVEYKYSSEDASTKINIATSIKGPSAVIQRVNSYVAYIDILGKLKNGETISEFLPFMITADNVRVESRAIGSVTVSQDADLENLTQNDINFSNSANPNYPNFITPPSQS